MASDRTIRVYQELATHYDSRGEPQVRDRFLVLAADAANAAGRPDEAESLRRRLLQLNPHHMLKPYSSWSQALQSPDVKSYIDGLQRTYPPASAENLLASVRGSLEEDAGPKPLPSAALEMTLPYTAPDSPSNAPTAPISKSVTPIPIAKEVRTAAPVAGVPRPVPVPPAKESVPQNGLRLGPAVPPAPTWPTLESVPRRREKPASAWVSVLLFYVVLGAGLALLAYTFVRPFYPLPGSAARSEKHELKTGAVER